MRFVLLPVAVAALLLCTAARADEQASTYLLSVTMHDGARSVGSPRLLARAGEPAQIEVNDGVGHRYAMSVVATAADMNHVRVRSSLDVASDDLRTSSKSETTVEMGRAISYAFGKDPKAVRIDLTVTPAKLN